MNQNLDIALLLEGFPHAAMILDDTFCIVKMNRLMEALLHFPYPGNIRELKNIIEFAVNTCKGRNITKENLPAYIFEPQVVEYNSWENQRQLKDTEPSTRQLDNNDTVDQGRWEDIERSMVVEKLKEFRGNRTKSAEALGWGRMKLWRKMKHYKLI